MDLEFDSPDGDQLVERVAWLNVYEHGKAILVVRTVRGEVEVVQFDPDGTREREGTQGDIQDL